MKKFAVIVGHTSTSQGAYSPHGIGSEFAYNSNVAKYLTDIADVYHYESYKQGYRGMVNKVFSEINQKDYLLTIELHYNSVGDSSANGSSVLYYHMSGKGKAYAEKLSEMLSHRFGTKNRGITGRRREERGGYALYAGKAPAVLVEPFFGSNKEDVGKFKGREREYATLIRDFLKWVENEN